MRSLSSQLVMLIALLACDASVETTIQIDDESYLSTAEAFIDVFYSFDPLALEATLSSAAGSVLAITYYQGWAEGGNYKIVDRKHCEIKAANVVSCSITVEDDPMLALGIDFDVTDTFEITFTDTAITAVETSSDDIQLYYDARDWVRRELPALVEEPCQGYFDGGPTPGDCARAMAQGYIQFAASDDFPHL